MSGRAPGISRVDLGLLVLLGVIWGAAFPVIRLGLVAGASPLTFAAVRYGLAGLAMAAIAWVAREKLPTKRTMVLYIVLGGGLVIGGYAAFLYLGEEQVAAGLATVLVATAPLWSAVFGAAILPSEQLDWRGGVGVVTGFVGVVVLFLPTELGGARGPLYDEILVLCAPISFCLGAVLVRRLVQEPTKSWGTATEFGVAGLLLGAIAVGTGNGVALPLSAPVLGSLAYLIIGPSIAGYAIYFRLLHRVGPTRSSLVAYVNPLTGITLGVLILGETVGFYELAGFLIIVAGLFLLQSGRAPEWREEGR